jgi:hypothetical protein
MRVREEKENGLKVLGRLRTDKGPRSKPLPCQLPEPPLGSLREQNGSGPSFPGTLGLGEGPLNWGVWEDCVPGFGSLRKAPALSQRLSKKTHPYPHHGQDVTSACQPSCIHSLCKH